MKQFFIYHSRGNDPLMSVQRIHNRAAAHARKIGKAVAITDVDIDTAGSSELKCYSQGGTIECVTADGDACKERQRNPAATAINGMIERV